MFTKKPPILLFNYANIVEQPLKYLGDENSSVIRLLTPAANKQLIQIHQHPYVTINEIVDYLEVEKRITLFHYSGHSNSKQIMFTDQAGDAKGVAHLLKKQKKIKLVFLNGCSNYHQAKLLLELGIPAIIATDSPIDDKSASEFAIRFYKSIAGHHTIKESFEHAASPVRIKTITKVRTSRDTELRDLNKNKIPWNLYYKEENNINKRLVPIYKEPGPFGYLVISFIIAFFISIPFFIQEKDENNISNLEYLNQNFSKIQTGSYKVGLDSPTVIKINELKIPILNNHIDNSLVNLDSFFIGKYEVTEKDYYNFIKDSNYDQPPYWNKNKLSFFSKSKKPVVEVSWNDAKLYCKWLQGKLNVKKVRLPNEAEWEVAAKGKTTNIFSWGDKSPNQDLVNFYSSKSIPVDTPPFDANLHGVFHMSGNVEEWCESSKDLKRQSCQLQKVVKGGSYNSNVIGLLITSYRCVPTESKSLEIGFRVVIIK